MRYTLRYAVAGIAAVLLSALLAGNSDRVLAAEVKVIKAQARFSRGLLWRVSKPGVAASHVFGTMHIADPRVLLIPDAVMQALAQAKTYAMEIQSSVWRKGRAAAAAEAGLPGYSCVLATGKKRAAPLPSRAVACLFSP